MADSEILQGENERMRLLLDSSPISCRLMRRVGIGSYDMIECNEKAVELFGFRDKEDAKARYFITYPKNQPDGSNSIARGIGFLEKAYAEGRCVSEFTLQDTMGALIPCEVTLVRVRYGNEYVVAGYNRDLREHNEMLRGIRRRDELLGAMNRVAGILLAASSEGGFEATLLQGMRIIGECLGVGCVWIWRNESVGGDLHFALRHKWVSEGSAEAPSIPIGTSYPYTARMLGLFGRGECMNGPVSELPPDERELLAPLGLKSTVAIPMLRQGVFWGILCVDDFLAERRFADGEIEILKSTALMLLNAIDRDAQASLLREALGRASLLLDTAPFAIHFWDKDERLFDCNEYSVLLFKMDDKQGYLERFDQLSPELQPDGSDSAAMKSHYIRKAFREGRASFNWMHRTADGEPLPSEITLVRVGYGDGHAVAGYVRDLREHNRMMAEIDERDKLLAAGNRSATLMLSAMDDERFEASLHESLGVIGANLDVDRVQIWRNESVGGELCFVHRYEWLSEFGERNVAVPIGLGFPYSSKPDWLRRFRRGECVNAPISALTEDEALFLSAYGMKSIVIIPLFMRGDFWGFFSVDDCRRDRSLTEETIDILRSIGLMIANALLRREMTMRLRQASDAKSDFLASMSHEMRTPLNAVIGLTRLMLEGTALDAGTRANLGKVHGAGDMLLSIVNDILDISKIEAGKMELVEVDYDVPSLINDTVAQNILRIGEKPIELRLDIGGDLLSRLHGDELRVKQIMNNLLSNAIKYTKEGHVELRVRCERAGPEVEPGVGYVWLEITISDTGIGIRPEDIGDLFKDYAQLDLKENRKAEGTGLGLPITKSLVSMMGGTVGVESEYGRGSAFAVRILQKSVSDVRIGQHVADGLKANRYADEKRARDSRFRRIQLPYARVLVVDDNATNLDVAKGLLSPYGMKVDCVSGGRLAVEAIREQKARYDAVFMDHMMPDLDGIEATRIIREEIGTDYARAIPIIALTANAIAGNEAMFLSKGFQAFISKPIEMGRLDEVIRRWVRDPAREGAHGDGFDAVGGAAGGIAGGIAGQAGCGGTDIRDGIGAGGGDGLGPRPGAAREGTGPEAGLGPGIMDCAPTPLVDVADGLRRFGGDEVMYQKSLRSYWAHTGALLDRLGEAGAGDLTDYGITVHGIKGASRSIGARVTGDLAEALELASSKGDREAIVGKGGELVRQVREVIAWIGGLPMMRGGGAGRPRKAAPDPGLLRRLHEACDRLETDAIDECVRELEAFEYDSGGGLVAEIAGSANRFDYGEVMRRLSPAMGGGGGTDGAEGP
ncbi:MAG: ATP-binding protein [Oscillospiraceae bacterium]|nr:ATP-binding protein [Oscillospiraceae bacterium]